jgi:hypothetical protein
LVKKIIIFSVGKFNYQALLRIRSYLLFALLTSFVIGAVYFANTQEDTFPSSTIAEVADYARDIEDSSDPNPLTLFTASLDPHLPLDSGSALNATNFKPSLTGLYYHARPRSPPFQA